jgi:Pvc16 N-terminal domain
VIPEVDQALKTLIEREAVDPAEVEVVFDAPTTEWAGRRNGPTIDVYLYDIREDLRRRERGFLNEYDGDRVRARHLPPRYFKLSYLVAAWTQRPEDEHRLLASLLLCFLRYDALPSEVLGESLAALKVSVPVTVALPPPEDRSFADVWTALGGELKPSLDVVVTAPLESGRSFPAGPPVQWPTSLVAEGLEGSVPAETLRRGATATALSRIESQGGGSVRIRKRRPKSGGS